MQNLELWKQILLIVLMVVLLLACSARLAYAILSPAKEFKEDIEFKPPSAEEVIHVRHNSSD